MSQDHLNNPEDINEGEVCKNCGSLHIEEDYILPLCKDCRNLYANRVIPGWVKGFFLLIAVTLLFSLIHLPDSLNAAIAFKKGKLAEQDRNIVTAIKEYKKVEGIYPDSMPVIESLSINYFYNNQVSRSYDYLQRVVGKEASSDEALVKVNKVIEKMSKLYIPGEKFYNLLEGNNIKNKSLIEKKYILEQYIEENPDDLYAKSYLSNIYYDLNEYSQAEKFLLEIIGKYPDFIEGLLLISSINRNTGNYEKAISYINKIFEINRESADGYSALSLIELKRFEDKKGLELAQKAYKYGNDTPYIKGYLALAYHFNSMYEERDRVMDELKDTEYNKDQLQFLNDVFSGKEIWR